MNRHQKIQNILTRAKEINANPTTIIFLLATMSDKALTKFYAEFMYKDNIKKERFDKLNKISK